MVPPGLPIAPGEIMTLCLEETTREVLATVYRQTAGAWQAQRPRIVPFPAPMSPWSPSSPWRPFFARLQHRLCQGRGPWPMVPPDAPDWLCKLAAMAYRGQPVRLTGQSIREANLRGCDLSDMCLGDNHWLRVDFRHANLTGTSFKGAMLTHSRFAHAHLNHANLEDVQAGHADFQGAILAQAHLEGGNFFHANFEGAVAVHARMRGAILNQANLTNATLDHAAMGDAWLGGAIREGTSLVDIQGPIRWGPGETWP